VESSGRTSTSYSVLSYSASVPAAEHVSTEPGPPELADVGRLARRLLRRTVAAARADDVPPVQRVLRGHLGPGGAAFPTVSSSWPAYDQVNVQAGLNGWLAAAGRQHELVGLTGYRHSEFGIADLFTSTGYAGHLGVGTVARIARPAGPDGQTLACVQCGLYLIHDDGRPLVLLVRGPDEHGSMSGVSLEVCAEDEVTAQRVIDEVRRFTVERNVYRGHVIGFGGEVFGDSDNALLSFLDRPQLDRSGVILPPALLDGIEQHVLGIARHAELLRASGQHLKRGLLLYGAPGAGKTHTVRYLIGKLVGTTVIVISGASLGYISAACSVARVLQPAVIVVEDVDLIAEDRDSYDREQPMLFELLNEMDGLGADTDVTFLLTTNRADLLEEALAARPGRVDHAAEIPIPDADARRQLIELYRGSLILDLADTGEVIARTEGVTASFLKELLRRSALVAAEKATGGGDTDRGGTVSGPLHVSDADMTAALDQLLDVRSQLTRVLLGGAGRQQPG
jgi:hypothetical protein